MTYFPDLSEYRYLSGEPAMLNVGWLDSEHSFPVGSVVAEAVTRLLVLAREPMNVMRGMHSCELCDQEPPIVMEAPVPGRTVLLGTGEVHVRGSGGLVYAAPTLIAHYIAEHRYLPPSDFLDGLTAHP